jgi:hypothetical protein
MWRGFFLSASPIWSLELSELVARLSNAAGPSKPPSPETGGT